MKTLDDLGVERDQWEGGHRTPWIVRWPGKVAPGSTSSQLISTTDLMATCAAVIGHDLPTDAAEDSYDSTDALWSMKPYALPDTDPGASGQLYDLAADPGETANLFSRRPDVVARLKALLDESVRKGRSAPLHGRTGGAATK